MTFKAAPWAMTAFSPWFLSLGGILWLAAAARAPLTGASVS